MDHLSFFFACDTHKQTDTTTTTTQQQQQPFNGLCENKLIHGTIFTSTANGQLRTLTVNY